MPELPEVETIRRQLEPRLLNAAIVLAWGSPNPKFTTASSAMGSTITRLDRRGKYLIARLDDDRDLIVHLGMTGKLSIIAAETADLTTAHLRAWWRLDDERILRFDDIRQFGRIAVTARDDHRSMPTLHAIGPEPFDEELTDLRFWNALRSSGRHLKTDLLSQRPIAGVGNIYADEALWLAGIHPADRTLTRSRAAALLEAIRSVLAAGIEHGGTTLRDYVDAEGVSGGHQHHLWCYGRAGEPCERCGSPLRRAVIDARGTTWCGVCQPRRR
ncbi:MAG: bifunctional DNA-formamidopyrimidine glycosylase/DNA-(apurinic or apyrimidinic site) lyase [Actinobacteria bacterium]|nr:bifunctional DNA-formamidopyrimidine glycosylase/DNA-(apurinic or apyrimidinic site) lyase [Actinomycetota bacterium]